MTDLDRLMAEKCMGWTAMRQPAMGSGIKTPDEWLMLNDDDNNLHCWRRNGISCSEDWHPTRDIAQAMICLEKYSHCWWEIENCARGIRCSIQLEKFGLVAGATADTPALAICKAIAKALEAK